VFFQTYCGLYRITIYNSNIKMKRRRNKLLTIMGRIHNSREMRMGKSVNKFLGGLEELKRVQRILLCM